MPGQADGRHHRGAKRRSVARTRVFRYSRTIASRIDLGRHRRRPGVLLCETYRGASALWSCIAGRAALRGAEQRLVTVRRCGSWRRKPSGFERMLDARVSAHRQQPVEPAVSFGGQRIQRGEHATGGSRRCATPRCLTPPSAPRHIAARWKPPILTGDIHRVGDSLRPVSPLTDVGVEADHLQVEDSVMPAGTDNRAARWPRAQVGGPEAQGVSGNVFSAVQIAAGISAAVRWCSRRRYRAGPTCTARRLQHGPHDQVGVSRAMSMRPAISNRPAARSWVEHEIIWVSGFQVLNLPKWDHVGCVCDCSHDDGFG